MTASLEALSALPPNDLTRLLLQLSQLKDDEIGIQQGERAIVENLLQFRFGELDEQLGEMVESFLVLPPQELRGVLEQLPDLSGDELLRLLRDLQN